MYLFIDTTEKDSFDIALLDKERVIKKKTVQSHRKHSEKLLKSIEMMLKSAKARLKDVCGILVVRGPGSFTSLRIGVATANALAFGLSVPIQGIEKSNDLNKVVSSLDNIFKNNKRATVVVPEYGQLPHIA
ncbi:tRNA (adenosine(37)-N6)-threonylcarbamoyltransferase complex dimerization subunit type 1 TsaB [Patescibacteria group bacterium]|nr:tRNA (adenosine(37)-N6)-threonylcarbamoyltransferase complex dimerization subunit type 1 TsaB [Patescibacteria group bacterium]